MPIDQLPRDGRPPILEAEDVEHLTRDERKTLAALIAATDPQRAPVERFALAGDALEAGPRLLATIAQLRRDLAAALEERARFIQSNAELGEQATAALAELRAQRDDQPGNPVDEFYAARDALLARSGPDGPRQIVLDEPTWQALYQEIERLRRSVRRVLDLYRLVFHDHGIDDANRTGGTCDECGQPHPWHDPDCTVRELLDREAELRAAVQHRSQMLVDANDGAELP